MSNAQSRRRRRRSSPGRDRRRTCRRRRATSASTRRRCRNRSATSCSRPTRSRSTPRPANSRTASTTARSAAPPTSGHKPGTDLLVCAVLPQRVARRARGGAVRLRRGPRPARGHRRRLGRARHRGRRRQPADPSSAPAAAPRSRSTPQSAMTARCHWCRHVFGVNEQVPNGAVPDAVLPFHIKKDDAVARIRQFVDKRRLFALKEFKEQFTPENVSRRLPAVHDRRRQGERRRGRQGRDRDAPLHPGQRQQQEDLLRRRRVPGGAPRGLHRGRPAARILARARQPRRQGQHQQHHQHDPAVRHQERGEVERVLPRGLHARRSATSTWSTCARGSKTSCCRSRAPRSRNR